VQDSRHPEYQYLDLLQDIIDNGVDKGDRTGIGTKAVFSRSLRFDLSKGFPLLTTKKTLFKGVAHELLWFIKGLTNIQYLTENGIHIWDDWADQNGELGPIYGKQWRQWESIVWVEPRICAKPKLQTIETPFNKDIVLDRTFVKLKPVRGKTPEDLIGKEIKSKNFGKFIVIKEYPTDPGNPRRFRVKFTKTGYECDSNNNINYLKQGKIKDPWFPYRFNVACVGEGSRDSLLYDTWHGMLQRCYDPSHIGYSRYGERGIFVCNRWLVFSDFEKDIKNLPGYHLKCEYPDEYTLDKDFYASNCYSPKTCCWISKVEQNINRELSYALHVITPAGNEFITMGIKKLCREFGLKSASIFNCLKEKQKIHHNFKFKKIEYEGFIPRIKIIDQLKDVIAQIKHNPNSRRILVNSWNVSDLYQMKLPPCHLFFEFQVLNGKLNCMFLMRSVDAFLGLPFNIASYALLTKMIAHICNLEPGELLFQGVDVHLYNNHVEQAIKQLQRKPFPFPELKLNSKIKNIDDFIYEDIELINYKSHKTIKAPIAI